MVIKIISHLAHGIISVFQQAGASIREGIYVSERVYHRILPFIGCIFLPTIYYYCSWPFFFRQRYKLWFRRQCDTRDGQAMSFGGHVWETLLCCRSRTIPQQKNQTLSTFSLLFLLLLLFACFLLFFLFFFCSPCPVRFTVFFLCFVDDSWRHVTKQVIYTKTRCVCVFFRGHEKL